MEFPGCIHCLWHDGDLRTLREVGDSAAEMSRDANGLSTEQQLAYDYYYHYNNEQSRKLYPKILPDFAGIDDFDTEEGYCHDGFGNSACPLDVSAAGNVSPAGIILIPFVHLFLLFALE